MPTFTHGKATKVLVEGVDLSTYFKDYNYASKMDTAETSTFGTSTKTYVQGLADSTLSLSGFFDGAVGAVDAVLSAAIGAAADIEVTVSPTGTYALGTAVIAGRSVETDYTVNGSVGSVVECSAAFQADGTIRSGVSIHDLTAETVGVTSTGTDTTRITATGGVLVVQATANTMIGTSTIKVQTSVDNITYVDYATVTLGIGAIGGFSAVVLSSAAVTANRWIRTLTTYSSTGSLTFQASFVRT